MKKKPLPIKRIRKIRVFNGDSRVVMKKLANNSVDSIVTDPPYALVSIVKRFGKKGYQPAKGNQAYVRAGRGFMGQTWDTAETTNDVAFWTECLRVLKPGGHLLSFGGTRTYHRMACAIEDAGFEIRDMVQWLYGSGFPKSHDVSKGIDGKLLHGKSNSAGIRKVNDTQQIAVGKRTGAYGGSGGRRMGIENNYKTEATRDRGSVVPITAPKTKEAKKYQGWGTALKPANEPIVLARKPLSEGTVAANVLKWGTGAINVDGCRVGEEIRNAAFTSFGPCHGNKLGAAGTQKARRGTQGKPKKYTGRFPANVITDGSDEVVAMFPNSGISTGGGMKRSGIKNNVYGKQQGHSQVQNVGFGDSGSAARFFYQAKANKLDRAGSRHPTVKPIALLRYLIRLVTPKDGLVLDPFAGSGTTAEAADMEGCKVILIEREKKYQKDIQRRLQRMRARKSRGNK